VLARGSEINEMLSTSPIMIVLYASIFIPLLAAIAYYKNKPGGTAKIRLLVVALISLITTVTALSLTMVRWSAYYGAWLEGGEIHVRYYANDFFNVSMCNTNISLVSIDDALGMLKIRTNGIADPSSGVYMGHYRLADGSRGDVIIISRNITHVLVVSAGREKAIVGLPGVETLYKTITEARSGLCGVAG